MKRLPIKLEVIFVKPEILEEFIDEKTGETALKVKMKFQQEGKINKNKRRYRKNILQREMDRLKPELEEGSVYGASFHPKKGTAEVNDVSHIWHKLWMEEDGSCVGEATLLPTSKGKDAIVIVRHGGKIGVSSRGAGTVTMKTEVIDGKKTKFEEVNDDYKMLSPGDLVLTPSVTDASVMMEILEKHVGEYYLDESQEEEEPFGIEISEVTMENLKKLKKDNPDEFKAYDASVIEAFKKSDEFKQVISEEVDKVKVEIVNDLEEKINKVDKETKEFVDAVRDSVNTLSAIPGVIDESNVDSGDNSDGGLDESKDLKITIEELKKKNKELEDAIQNSKDEVAEKERFKKFQIDLKAKVDEILANEKYVSYKTMIEEEIFVDGKFVGIDKIEETENVINDAFKRISTLETKIKQKKIEESGLGTKGEVSNPDKVDEKKIANTLYEKYISDREAGCELSFDEYKTKFGKV